jgi:hypothetical protein
MIPLKIQVNQCFTKLNLIKFFLNIFFKLMLLQFKKHIKLGLIGMSVITDV